MGAMRWSKMGTCPFMAKTKQNYMYSFSPITEISQGSAIDFPNEEEVKTLII